MERLGYSVLNRRMSGSEIMYEGEYEVRHVKEHYEVFLLGVFQFSADNLLEVSKELLERDKTYEQRYQTRPSMVL